LTDWLFERFDQISGINARLPANGGPRAPITFGDLAEKGLTLQLITTNLSELQPYVLPFKDRRFLFREEDLEKYLPRYAYEFMKATAYHGSTTCPPRGFSYLPDWDKLPIAFCARLSLSFPILIAAFPLYTIKASAFAKKKKGEVLELEEEDLARSWFSDGGICSNFPIHFFDHWLPSRPTFGITLGKMPDAEVTNMAHPLEGMPDAQAKVLEKGNVAVHLPAGNRVEASASHSIKSLFGLLKSVFNTAMSYHDTMQTQLPGFRERVVEIRLTDEEGGLNLDMDPERIKALVDKGAAAGALLRDRFDFEEHRWIRLQVLMPPLADELQHLGDQSAKQGWPGANHPYHRGEPWLTVARQTLDALATLAGKPNFELLKRKDPKPPATIRTTPRI
jgi:hypothetical protein